MLYPKQVRDTPYDKWLSNRKFNGVLYHPVRSFGLKTEAVKNARYWRKRGYPARFAMSGGRIHTIWGVYIRQANNKRSR